MDASESTASIVAAEIELSRLNWTGAFLLVEGPSDSLFWKARKSHLCDLVIANGRPNVLGALTILNSRSIRGALGVVDNDFDAVNPPNKTEANTVRTDSRDIEGMLLRSSALEKVLVEYGDESRINTFLNHEPSSVREALLRRAKLFGLIHWLNHMSEHSVSLDSLKPQRFCDTASWSYDSTQIRAEAVRLGVTTTVDELDRRLSELPGVDPWKICRGHDLVDILTGGLISVLGRNRAKRPQVEAMLRASFELSEFQGTSLFQSVRKWEGSNIPYVVIR